MIDPKEILKRMMTTEGKAETITLFLKYIETSQSISDGITKVKPSIDTIVNGELSSRSPETITRNMAQQISTLLKIQSQQQVLLANLSAIMMVYLSSDTFATDVAKALMKLSPGDGEDILKQMFKNKFGGKV